MTATAMRQAIMTAPSKMTIVETTWCSLSGRLRAMRSRGEEPRPRLGTGGLGVEQGVHA